MGKTKSVKGIRVEVVSNTQIGSIIHTYNGEFRVVGLGEGIGGENAGKTLAVCVPVKKVSVMVYVENDGYYSASDYVLDLTRAK